MADAPKELWNVLSAYVEEENIELDDVELLGGGGRTILRVTVDAHGGVDLDRIGDLTRGISRLLDTHDSIRGSYTLEVSSPGLERKLRLPAHYSKSVGRVVTVKTRSEVDGSRRHDGLLVEADEHGATLEIDGAMRRLDFTDITSAKTVYVWETPAKPGKK